MPEDRNAYLEKQRRRAERFRYVDARCDRHAAQAALKELYAANNEEEASKAGIAYFRAKAEYDNAHRESLRRWPSDLRLSCVGDAGGIGDLALVCSADGNQHGEEKVDYPYYAIVTFGSHTFGERKSYYRSLKSAWRDANTLGGGSLSRVLIIGAQTRQEAIDADIGDEGLAIVAHV